MRRRSSAEGRAARRGERAGFTLFEAMVSLIILVIVMVVVLSLLFSMKSFAEKQQAYTAPRQTARRALDYLTQTLEGAGDWNQVVATTTQPIPGNPYALVMFTEWGTSAASAARQASYNNLTAAQESAGFGTAGTDVISVAYPAAQTSPIKIPIKTAPAAAASTVDLNDATKVDLWLDYSAGCGVDPADAYNAANPKNVDNAANLRAFQRAVGGPWSETGAGGGVVSSLVIIADGGGSWRLAQLTGLSPSNANTVTLSSDCTKKDILSPAADAGKVIHATLKNASTTAQYLAPRATGAASGWRSDLVNSAAFLIAGIDFVSFRHRTVPDTTDPAGKRKIGRLEQKSSGISPGTGLFTPGIFDPVSDGTAGTTFTPIVDNVEDFQVAYVLTDGSIWNTAAQTFDNGATQVPLQAQAPGPTAPNCNTTGALLTGANLHAACVVGLRVSIVGKSQPMTLGSRQMTGALVNTAGESRARRLPVEDHGVPSITPFDTLDTGIYDRLRLTTTLMLRNRALGF